MPRRSGVFKRACGADMVCCDHIAQHCQYFGVADVADHPGLFAHILKIGWVLHIGGCRWPVIGLLIRSLDPLPFIVAFKDIGIFTQKGLTGHGSLNQFCNFLTSGPDVFQIDVIAVFVLS